MTGNGIGGPVLSVEHLAITFHQYERGLRRRTVTPVRDMSLSACAGEVVAVVGASGAGKSLIGLAAMGLLPPNAHERGHVAVHGQVLSPPERRAMAGNTLALLPQSGSFLDPLARVGDQVRRTAELAGLKDARGSAAAALARRDLSPQVAALRPHQLSGGMTRRVLFAMATVARPELIFADEPTPGLHPASAAAVLADIRGLADQGSAVVLVTHDIEQALTVADHIVICQSGRTLEHALPAQFHGDGSSLAHPYSRALWKALPGHGFSAPAGFAAPADEPTTVVAQRFVTQVLAGESARGNG